MERQNLIHWNLCELLRQLVSQCPKQWSGSPLVDSRCQKPCRALCFLAGANSIFYGEKLLTTHNPDTTKDQALFDKLGLRAL
jgi:biotin synthase-like enzyme